MVKDNKIEEEKINNSVTRILKIKEKYNITDNMDILGCNIEEINDRIEKLNSKLD